MDFLSVFWSTAIPLVALQVIAGSDLSIIDKTSNGNLNQVDKIHTKAGVELFTSIEKMENLHWTKGFWLRNGEPFQPSKLGLGKAYRQLFPLGKPSDAYLCRRSDQGYIVPGLSTITAFSPRAVCGIPWEGVLPLKLAMKEDSELFHEERPATFEWIHVDQVRTLDGVVLGGIKESYKSVFVCRVALHGTGVAPGSVEAGSALCNISGPGSPTSSFELLRDTRFQFLST